MFAHVPDPSPIIRWGPKPDSAAIFTDSHGRQCMLGDSSAAMVAAIRFGVIRSTGTSAGSRATMHLRLEELEQVIEPLRTFAASGVIESEILFSDWNGRDCVLRATPGVARSLDLGVLGAPSGNSGDNTIYPVDDSVMTLSQAHLEGLIGTLNTFVAHGSVRPD